VTSVSTTPAGARTNCGSPPPGRDQPVGLDGRPDPREAGTDRRAAPAGPPSDERPAAPLTAALRRPQAGRLARIERPGDLVDLDTLDIRPPPGKVWKQFTARDMVSRWDVVELGRRATAQAAAGVRDRLAERMPFPVRAISIDNGSEIIAEFETACRARGIRLFVLPPVRPSCTARSSGPTGPTPRSSTRSRRPSPRSKSFQVELRAWEIVYNTIRRHQALGYLTLAEYLAGLDS